MGSEMCIRDSARIIKRAKTARCFGIATLMVCVDLDCTATGLPTERSSVSNAHNANSRPAPYHPANTTLTVHVVRARLFSILQPTNMLCSQSMTRAKAQHRRSVKACAAAAGTEIMTAVCQARDGKTLVELQNVAVERVRTHTRCFTLTSPCFLRWVRIVREVAVSYDLR